MENIPLSATTILIIKIAGLLLLFLLGKFFLKRFLKLLHNFCQTANLPRAWGYSYLNSMDSPLQLLLLALLFSYIIQVIWNYFTFLEPITPVLHSLRSFLIVAMSGWLLLQWKNTIQAILIEKKEPDSLAIESAKIDFFGKLLSILIGLITILSCMSILNYPLEGILTVGGVGAAAIAFASQGVISNFFGSAVIYLTQPFNLGDYIAIHKEGVEGTVEYIGWYLSCIRNPDRQPIYVPNAIFGNAVVLNYTRMTHRRMKTIVSLRYQDLEKIHPIIESISQYLKEHKSIDASLPIVTAFSLCNSSSLDIEVSAYTIETDRSNFLELQQAILLQILEIVQANGASMPYPTQTIELIKT
jgi:MscS family membrane protein